ncbi:membrane protease YdiL (CAAX protease family) [Methanomicrobium sp. W14]|uniref:CPBP family intramembrane glutamic endopeptidase n=1 Tax=Methanomicrobium sp. W14 TaxID=2817839 RepID=UPI001AE2884C|nr:CPBP family intramembrane glutamic endopeptidase [Methanomicrobium sp. W14]MBP2133358.1 membrane protease YdiL (CAAX protease family) [Methanomicrobium sp. W14]
MTEGFENLNLKIFALIFALTAVCIITPFTWALPAYVTNFAYALMQVAPFIFLALLSYMSERYPGLKIFATLLLLVIILLMAVVSLSSGILPLLPSGFFESLESGGGELSVNTNVMDSTEMAQIVPGIAFLLLSAFAAVLLSLAGQIRAFRVFLSRYIPIDPDSFVHKTALTLILAITLLSFVPLLVTGIAPFLSPAFLDSSVSSILSEGIISQDIFSLLWVIAASFIAAGLWINRSLPEVLERLGLNRISKKEFLYAVGLGAVMVGVFLVIDNGITAIWEFFGWTVTDSDSVNLLFAAYLTPAAAFIGAISAGFSEEIAVRGLLQPRFGILIPSVLFASLHAFQYNWDSVLAVFIAGIVFALIRRYYCTTVSAITHTVYDLILFCALILGLGI